MRSWSDVLREFLGNYSANADRLFDVLMQPQMHTLQTASHGEVLCKRGDSAECFWLITDGAVEVYEEPDHPIRQRGPGHLVGEQAFLMARTPTAPHRGRTAELRAYGNTTLLRFDAALIDKLTPDQKFLWYELLAHVINLKLVEATQQRSALLKKVEQYERLVRKFGDPTALGIVRVAFDGSPAPTPDRDVIIWFSDIARFSTWSKSLKAAHVATTIKQLLGLQMKLIREYGGEVDKTMGDGLMAYWFCDTLDRRTSAPPRALACAQRVVEEFGKLTNGNDMDGLSLRIGLHCGPACFGDFGTDDRVAVTVLGETINLGARYEQLHAPAIGPIRISKTLYDRIAAVDADAVKTLNGPRTEKVKEDEFEVYWA